MRNARSSPGRWSSRMASLAWVVILPRWVVECPRPRGRPFLSSSAMPVPDVAACLAAVDILEGSTELVDKLWENTRYFKTEVRGLGFDTGLSTTPITPIMLGEAPLAQQFSRELFENGLFALS